GSPAGQQYMSNKANGTNSVANGVNGANGANGHGKKQRKTRLAAGGDIIAALDVGTTKVCCFIARRGEDGRPRVMGIGHQLSRGLRGGAIVDMEAADSSILAAVHAA